MQLWDRFLSASMTELHKLEGEEKGSRDFQQPFPLSKASV